MTLSVDLFETAKAIGARLWARIAVRDGAHLGPARLSRAAAARLRAGIRAVEAYLRRLLVLMALELERTLAPDPRPRARYAAIGRRARRRGLRLNVFAGELALPDFSGILPAARLQAGRGGLLPAGPLVERLEGLKALLDAPERRARRLAFHLARRRPGPVLAPGLGRAGVPARLGTEVSATYAAFAVDIARASQARPPPLDPAPRPPPRVRCL